MNSPILFSAGHTDALDYACAILREKGCCFSPVANPSVTHLLLPVPAFLPDGQLRGGVLSDTLQNLSPEVTVLGGNLNHSALDTYRKEDLLQDPLYLAENAAITAHCAISLAAEALPITLADGYFLVIGWGRIGKCLAPLLRSAGGKVTVAARKAQDRAMLTALGYDTLDTGALSYELLRFDGIFNTVPAPVITEETAAYCRKDCLKIELSSVKGIAGEDVIWARGLPNQCAPASSGKLIARTVLNLLKKE